MNKNRNKSTAEVATIKAGERDENKTTKQSKS